MLSRVESGFRGDDSSERKIASISRIYTRGLMRARGLSLGRVCDKERAGNDTRIIRDGRVSMARVVFSFFFVISRGGTRIAIIVEREEGREDGRLFVVGGMREVNELR